MLFVKNEAHFPDENFRKNVENSLDVNKDGILSKAEREDVYYAEIGGVGYKDTWWYTDMKFSEHWYGYAPGISVTPDEGRVKSASKKTFSVSLTDFSTGRPAEVMDITIINQRKKLVVRYGFRRKITLLHFTILLIIPV